MGYAKHIQILSVDKVKNGTRIVAIVQRKTMSFTITHNGFFDAGFVIDEKVRKATTPEVADLAQLWIEQFGSTTMSDIAADITTY